MNPGKRRTAALNSIDAARRAIITTAAHMTARGIDTTPLADPVFDLQRAVAELRKLDRKASASRRPKRAPKSRDPRTRGHADAR